MNDSKSLLIVDDDEVFLNRLGRAMERKGFSPILANSVEEGKKLAAERVPEYAVIDLRLEDGNGLEVVEALRKVNEEAVIVMLTGYGNIASAVAAVKAGAIDYLAKPANVEDIVNALMAESDSLPMPPENPMSADRVRWEHIQRVYELCDHNVSETARRLNMHRRTLQRIMAKRSPQ
ncbi:ActR/PrrA/RegA family redox response regulator transcription factor [Sneathiella sp.]|uniref:ActR/PrrA/RegA family redox response regulator transcription factor n=1 Tax=Sneathiella sp. TaxID=1964365 RepID=UPI002FE1D8A9